MLAALADRSLEFLFLAPEQLGNDETFAALRRARPTLFVVGGGLRERVGTRLPPRLPALAVELVREGSLLEPL